jgi:ferredoxin
LTIFRKKMVKPHRLRRYENACLGCGVCFRFCPEEAISLQEGLRRVFILPPKMRQA